MAMMKISALVLRLFLVAIVLIATSEASPIPSSLVAKESTRATVVSGSQIRTSVRNQIKKIVYFRNGDVKKIVYYREKK